MSLRFASQLQIDNLPDEQTNDQFEVIMPAINLAHAIGTPKKTTEESKSFLDKAKDSVSGYFGELFSFSYRPIVEEITFGPRQFKTTTRRVRTGWYNVPEDIENYHEVNITMFCSSNMLTQLYLEAWRTLIFNEEGEYYYGGNNYKRNIEVLIFGPGGGTASVLMPTTTFTLVGCFPKLQEDYKLQYSNDPQRFRIMATFCVDNIKINRQQAKAAMLTELATSPGSLADKLFSSALGNNGDYSTASAYITKGNDYNTKPSEVKK